MACMIEKNMSTMLHAIMCFLNDEGAFLEQGRSFDQECTYSLYVPYNHNNENRYNNRGLINLASSF